MFRNKRTSIMLLMLFFLFDGCSYLSNIKKSSDANSVSVGEEEQTYLNKNMRVGDRLYDENDLIIQAIWYEMNGYYRESNYFYSLLYEKTGGVEYLFRELTTALYAGIISKNIPKLEELVEKNPETIQLKRLLISFYINEKENRKAKGIGEELINESGESIDYELSASPYILSGDYDKAVELLMVAYNKTYNEDILMKITVLLTNYMDRTDDAIRFLERHREEHQCTEKLCSQLIEIYSSGNNGLALADVYRDLYRKTSKEIYAINFVDTLVSLEEFDMAIEFLQDEYYNDELLYEMYLAKRDYNNALSMAERLYFSEKTPRWLAESAMVLYEKSEDKSDKRMLNSVIDKFERAIRDGVDDSVYLNYYGYTLIDNDIDVEKGINIIKDALKDDPNNTYYLDSLAWGYYKLNECQMAYREMKRVVDVEGLKEEDIAQHWNAILNCKNKYKGTKLGKNIR